MAVDLPKLHDAVREDYLAMSNFRVGITEAIREFVGGHYGTDCDDKTNPKNPVNLISLYVRVLGGFMVGSDPRMQVQTFNRQLKAFAEPMQDWGNKRLQKMKFADTYRRAIEDAFLAPMGIVKTYPTSPAQSRFSGYGARPAQVWCSNVAYEDFVCDTRAKRLSECDYMGCRYRVLFDDVMQSKLYEKKAKKNLVAKDDSNSNIDGSERIQTIGIQGSSSHHYYDYVELWEIWDRYENIIITYDADGDFEEPLMVQDWVGHSCGPYQFMFFQEVPGNLFPKPPFMDWVDTHREYNTLWCKGSQDAIDSKQVVVYADESEAGAFERAKNGQFVKSSRPNDVQPKVVNPGPMPNVMNWMMNVREVANKHAGNPDALGGLGMQADTATQEKLIHASAGQLIQSMGHRATFFAKDVFSALGDLWWKSPNETFTARYTPTGLPDYGIDREITPIQRFGKPFGDLDFTMDVYSVVALTPTQQANLVTDTVKNFILPILPMLGQPGMVEMIGEVIKMIAEVNNCPRLMDVWEKMAGMEGPPVEQAAEPDQMQLPNEPTEHVRISKPGMTDRGQSQVMAQMMASNQTGLNGQDLGQFGRAG